MLKSLKTRAFSLWELLVVLCLWFMIPALWLFVGGMWTQHNISFWLTYAKHAPTHCPYLLGVAANILAPVAFLFDIVTEIAKLALS